MTRKLSRADREKASRLRAAARQADSELTGHKKICAQCHNPDNWPRHACDDGWNLAKKATRAANNRDVFLGTIEAGELDGQVPLW